VKRLQSSNNVTDVMEQIVGRGIVLDPWVSIVLSEPERLRKYRWVADCHVHESDRYELRRAG
jgi:hypothetical protein